MANFESGVASYIQSYAVVQVQFPVDFKGCADICCFQCRFFRRNSQSCALNGEICEYPGKYVGSHCPLVAIEENPNEKEQ